MKMDAISQLHKKLLWEPNSLKRSLQSFLFLATISSLLCLTNFSFSSINLLTNLSLFNDKEAMFFLCNVLLFLVAKDTGLLGHSHERDLCRQSLRPKALVEVLEVKDRVVVEARVESESSESKSLELDVAREERERRVKLVENAARQRINGTLPIASIKRAQIRQPQYISFQERLEELNIHDRYVKTQYLTNSQIDSHRSAPTHTMVVNEFKDESIDELNKRFDEFIEKVKRDRRMEATRGVLV